PASENLEVFLLRQVYSVSRLNAEARGLLEENFALIWVEGELSNLARPSSGHWYFSLKDKQAHVRCAMFRVRNRLLGFTPQDGMQVLLRARVSLYEGRGEFQLIGEHMEEAGDGALRRAFDLLKQRLAVEGLFDAAHKKPLPTLPRKIGVITSPTGAALRDILCCLRRRFPAIPVLLYPVPVQGQGAADKIARAIQMADARADCDVLIVSRGGGSLEDLWAFNEEVVVRAIYACSVPIVSGIGHEIDFTIADLVADHRAATPSAAAELLSPDRLDWLKVVGRLQGRLALTLQTVLAQKRQTFHWLQRRLQHPGQRLLSQAQRLDDLEQRLRQAQRSTYRYAKYRLAEVQGRLQNQTPLHKLKQLSISHANLQHRLHSVFNFNLLKARGTLESLARALDAVSPLATLGRGYAIVHRLPDRTVLRSTRDVSAGDMVEARLAHGTLLCIVDKVDYE
ncbi:MAG: exodeoxyribonuclease VII large subunit, partial [Gammaproteobacteria bacterium]